MADTALTCADVEERDLEARYLAGRLSPEEAELFEAHYFGCERCWQAVQRGLELRAALAPPPAPSALRQRQDARGRQARRAWWPLAAAASVALVAVATWQITRTTEIPPGGGGVLRGDADSLPVVTASGVDLVSASWPRSPRADVYRVRAYAGDGALLIERETSDTTISVSRDSVLLIEVEALSPLRAVVGRSGLVRVPQPGGP